MSTKTRGVIGKDEQGRKRFISSGMLCRAKYDYVDEYSHACPLRGVKMRIVEYVGYSKSGYDCTVEVLCTPEELAARFEVAYGEACNVDQIRDIFSRDMYDPSLYDYLYKIMSPDHLYCEFETCDLVLIDEDLIRQAKGTNDE